VAIQFRPRGVTPTSLDGRLMKTSSMLRKCAKSYVSEEKANRGFYKG